MSRIPHPVPYQGSKRRLASAILRFAPAYVDRLIEPFAGSAAITVATAARGLARRYLIGEKLEPLAKLLEAIIESPEITAIRYEKIWRAQLGKSAAHFLEVRSHFNENRDPLLLLYLLARCVKNAVRFNPRGEFNQSADHRRKGMRPEKMRAEIFGMAKLLAGRAEIVSADYRSVLRRASPKDLVYMDPPYQGVSVGRDSRYIEQLDLESFLIELEKLNSKKIPFLLSFDGYCGSKEYGQTIPEELGLKRVLIDTGRSTQATLAGRNEVTRESLYLSPTLAKAAGKLPREITIDNRATQMPLSL